MRYNEFRPLFAAAMDPRLYPIEYLDWLLNEGLARIWFSENASIVAEIKTFPSGAKAVSGVIAAGDKAEIVGLIAHAEAWGREEGCAFGMIESRDGWAREMKPYGYEPFQTAILKEL